MSLSLVNITFLHYYGYLSEDFKGASTRAKDFRPRFARNGSEITSGTPSTTSFEFYKFNSKLIPLRRAMIGVDIFVRFGQC